MSGLMTCPVCPHVAEEKRRPIRAGDFYFIEMKRIPEGVGGYCGKCSMFGVTTKVIQRQTYDEKTGKMKFVYDVTTNYDKFPKPDPKYTDDSDAVKNERLFNYFYDKMGANLRDDIITDLRADLDVEEKIKESYQEIKDELLKVIEKKTKETKKRGRPPKDPKDKDSNE